MELRLGDKRINRMGYGAMRLPGIRELPENTDLSVRLLREAVSLGANVIDTADYYGDGLANRLIAEALRPYPDELVIATKVGVKAGANGHPEPAASADEIKGTVERDLDGLGASSLDLVFLRLPGGPLQDSGVPIEQSMECLAELQADGVIKHIGLSSASTGQIEAAKSIASVDAVQNVHFVGNPGMMDVVHLCESEGIPFLAYFPLGMGILIRKKVDLGPLAAAYQASESQIALAWLLALSPVIVPIPGSSNIEHVRENMAASSLSLSASDVESLSNVA
jgi:pyridoxine 4-dehydrogenase